MAYAQPLIRVNGFDFDSTAPVQAHELKEASTFMPWVIEQLLAWDLVFLGAWAIKWVYFGGYGLISMWFAKYAPGIYLMATTGQL